MSQPASVLRRGDCFRFAEKESHLWIVLSDPFQEPDRVLVVNVTTLKAHKDKTCVLNANAHPEITHDSCVNYAKARVYPAAQLNSLLARGKIYPRDGLDGQTLAYVWEKAILSPHTKRPHSELLLSQGVEQAAEDESPESAAPQAW
jgi:hypothetical protein